MGFRDLFRDGQPQAAAASLPRLSGFTNLSDWSDTGECHSTQNTRRKTGRIYRLTYGETKLPPVDLTTMSNMELVKLQLDDNDWKVRHARRLLHEKAIAGDNMAGPHKRLKTMFEHEQSVPRKLRALWALHVTGGIDDTFLVAALSHPSEDVASWAVTLLCEDCELKAEAMRKFIAIAKKGKSALVRLSMASALQRLAHSSRWHLATALASRAEDAADQNLPLMIWYGSEPLVDDDIQKFVDFAATAAIPRVRINAARRIAVSKDSTVGISLLVDRLAKPNSTDVCIDLMAGILKGIEGKRKLPTPARWHKAFIELSKHDHATIKSQIIRLSLAFNDPKAIESLKGIAADHQQSNQHRMQAIEALVDKRVEGFGKNLLQLLSDKAVQEAAIRGLAAYNEPQTAVAILRHYGDMTPSERLSANNTLTSRIAWADTLLTSTESNSIKSSELNAHSARQVRALGDDNLSRRLASCWGEIRETPKAKRKQIQSLKKRLSKRKSPEAELTNGKRLFTAHCASCHQLFGEGGTIGPDITGSQRGNLEYMLENIVDPNASVAKDYQVEMLETVDGRLITGLIESEDIDTITVQTINERLVFPTEDIEGRKKSALSIMPEGLLDPLSDKEIRDLMEYLRLAK